MAATPIVYVICDQNCKFEGMTKEQILAAISQAVNDGVIRDVDAGFITKIKTINGRTLRFFVGEQSAYDALTAVEKEDLFAIISNDTTKDGLLKAIEELKEDQDAMKLTLEEKIPIYWKGYQELTTTPQEFIFISGSTALTNRVVEVVTTRYGIIRAYIDVTTMSDPFTNKIIIDDDLFLISKTFKEERNGTLGEGLYLYLQGTLPPSLQSVKVLAVRLSEKGVYN